MHDVLMCIPVTVRWLHDHQVEANASVKLLCQPCRLPQHCGSCKLSYMNMSALVRRHEFENFVETLTAWIEIWQVYESVSPRLHRLFRMKCFVVKPVVTNIATPLFVLLRMMYLEEQQSASNTQNSRGLASPSATAAEGNYALMQMEVLPFVFVSALAYPL